MAEARSEHQEGEDGHRDPMSAGMYSNLHTNILDSFHAAGVEIMSPRYSAVRDGNHVAMPDANVPTGYQAPAFGVLWRRNRPAGAV